MKASMVARRSSTTTRYGQKLEEAYAYLDARRQLRISKLLPGGCINYTD